MTNPADIRAALSEPYRHGMHHDFAGITCEGRLDLSGLMLSGVDFTGAQFPNGIDARGARFDGLSWFRGATFGGAVHFADAVFSSDARFDDAHFVATAHFAGTDFRGIARFDRARFSAGLDAPDMICNGNCSFEDVQVEGHASVARGEFLGGLWCQNAHFASETDLAGTQVHGRLWLRGATRGNTPMRHSDIEMVFGYAYV